MWALTLLAVLQAARANSCIRISYGTDESGAKTVSKSFAITARAPEACKKNQFSGLGPTKAFALEVSILKVLNEKQNASSYTTRKCRDRYFPRLLERNDPNGDGREKYRAPRRQTDAHRTAPGSIVGVFDRLAQR